MLSKTKVLKKPSYISHACFYLDKIQCFLEICIVSSDRLMSSYLYRENIANNCHVLIDTIKSKKGGHNSQDLLTY